MTIKEDGKFSLINAEFEKLSGYSKEELENKKKWTDFFLDDDLERVQKYHHLRRIDQNKVPRNYEARFIDRHNNVKYICLTVAMIPDSKKSLISCLDITELKKSEEVIIKSLKEKELLIREIHHRVKNNMQIIISLLSLQSSYTDNNEAKDIFRECQNRVRSMGMIHESLYQSKDLSSTNFTEYVKRLVNELFISYGVDSNRIKAKISVENISLSIDTAIPCGLLINEIISNSLKHAFPGDRKGEIYIDFHQDEQGKFILTVGDNGIRFPEKFDFRNTTTLGLNLVNTLVKQLDATIDLHKNDKTEFIIIFSELEYNKRI